MIQPFISLSRITKKYAGKIAVDAVELDIAPGIIFGMLGPNGAGKTSIIRMITSITAPDEGTIYFKGESLNEAHNRMIGYMPEERGLYKKMKVGEHLIYLLRLRGMDVKTAKGKTKEWMEKMDVADWANKAVGELSKGMQQKVQFIATVAHDPELLILDEPFSGLDPINSRVIENVIQELKAKGTTIIFSTHRMEQVEELCDRIGLINQGRLVLEDDVNQARRKFYKNEWQLEWNTASTSSDTADKKLKSLRSCKLIHQENGKALVELLPGIHPSELLLDLAQTGLEFTRAEAHLPRLNEIFIEVVKTGEIYA